MKNKDLKIGIKYKVKTPHNDEIYYVEVDRIKENDIVFKDLENESLFSFDQPYDIVKILEDFEWCTLYQPKFFSISNNLIKAVLGRDDLIKHIFNKTLPFDHKETVLISITNPDRNLLDKKYLSDFQDSLSVQFYDIEEEYTENNIIHKPIQFEQAKALNDFIFKNKDKSFVIHCEEGYSRSAGIALAIEFLLKNKLNGSDFFKSNTEINKHHRYNPNKLVFDSIINIKRTIVKKLYIDDIRNPKNDGFDIVRSWKEAIEYLNLNGCPEYISFDHDLGGDDTAMVIVKFLIEEDLDMNEAYNTNFIPSNFEFNVHSANPVGAANIEGYLNSYLNTRSKNKDLDINLKLK